MRADSGFSASEVVAVCRRMDIRFRNAIRQHLRVRQLIEAIPEDARTLIPHWLNGGADVAKTSYVPCLRHRCRERVNGQHIKAVPGRTTDVRDAEWMAVPLHHGLLRPSFIPERRELRELTRYRTSLLGQRTAEVNRIQKVLEGAKIELASSSARTAETTLF